MKKGAVCVNIHIVREGDTIQSISEKYGVKRKEIIEQNRHIANLDEVMIGMKIRINSPKTLPQSRSKKPTKTEKQVQPTVNRSQKDSLEKPINNNPLEALDPPKRTTRSIPHIVEDESPWDKQLIPYAGKKDVTYKEEKAPKMPVKSEPIWDKGHQMALPLAPELSAQPLIMSQSKQVPQQYMSPYPYQYSYPYWPQPFYNPCAANYSFV